MGILSTVGGGLFDFLTAQETNKANRENTNALIASQDRNQEKALSSLTGSDAFSTVSRNAEGGFDTSQLGGADAATARADLAFGDVGRAGTVNDATNNFAFSLPTLSDARGVVQGDNSLQQAQFDRGIDSIISQRQRTGGGIENQPHAAGTVDALSRFSQANRFGGEREALDLFNKSGQADVGLLQAILNANTPRAGAPAFTGGPPGGTAANAIVQSPPPAQSVDLSGALPFAAGGNILQQLQAQESADKEREFLLSLFNRTQGNQSAGTIPQPQVIGNPPPFNTGPSG